MRTIDFIIMMALTVFCASAAFVCEPIALNWDQFYALNDQNKDKKIQRSEWQSLNFNGSNYDAGFESSLPRAQIFQQMDKNKNGTLEEQEIYDLYLYLPNSCADFDMRKSMPDQKADWFSLQKISAFFNELFD